MGEIQEGWEIRGTSESVKGERGGGKRGTYIERCDLREVHLSEGGH